MLTNVNIRWKQHFHEGWTHTRFVSKGLLMYAFWRSQMHVACGYCWNHEKKSKTKNSDTVILLPNVTNGHLYYFIITLNIPVSPYTININLYHFYFFYVMLYVCTVRLNQSMPSSWNGRNNTQHLVTLISFFSFLFFCFSMPLWT